MVPGAAAIGRSLPTSSLPKPCVSACRRSRGSGHGHTCARGGTHSKCFGQYQLYGQLCKAKAVFLQLAQQSASWLNSMNEKNSKSCHGCFGGKGKLSVQGQSPHFGLCRGCWLLQLCLGVYPLNIIISSTHWGCCSEPNGCVAFNLCWINPRK